MKHLETDKMILEASRAAYPVTPYQAALLARHLQLVLERNETLNLTRITAVGDAINKHVIDSVAVAPLVDAAPGGELADLGSGAGFPGIPLAIVTGRHVTLVESVAKKASFLSDAVRELRVEASVSPKRAEELALTDPGRYAVVVARALTALPSLVELAAPLLMDHGVLLAMKGSIDDEERARGVAAAELVGLSLVDVRRLQVPHADERHVVVFERVGFSSLKLPRRVGLAQKRPLA